MNCLFLCASSSSEAYQDLAHKYMAIEPPTWALLLAESCRSKGFTVSILDALAENLSDSEVVQRVKDASPDLVVFVVYGQNPNAGTTGMIGASRTCKVLRESLPKQLISFVGSHVSALPKEVLETTQTDFVFTNEGVYALHEVLNALKSSRDWKGIKGIGYKNSKNQSVLNEGMSIVPQEKMDIDLPGYAWDLLPFREKPLDLYRAHYWHANFKDDLRTPFASIYTSLGCVFGCEFCMINILNREDMSDGVHAGNSRFMRYWSTEWVMRQLRKLSDMGAYTVRIADEMFFFREDRYRPLLEAIIDEGLHFNFWAYARVDTVRDKDLEMFKKAGVNWLCLGIEAGNRMVRKEISKGSFKDVKVDSIVESIQAAGIYVLGNYIFGFPHDTLQTMQETLDMAMDLCTEHANFYACTALPGSSLYYESIEKGWYVPSAPKYSEYAFLGKDHIPLPTNTLSASEVLRFRDDAWNKYFNSSKYIDFVRERLGTEAVKNVQQMASVKLSRKLLENND